MSLFPFTANDYVDMSAQGITASSVREYEVDFETNQLTGRIVEGVDAIHAWAYLALKAKRYHWVIYSWYYGAELTDLVGYSYSEEYVLTETRRYIEECLFEHDYITAIEDLEVSQIKDKLYIKFTMVTKLGNKEVEVDV